MFGPICWILRDGLGPDAVDSHGWQAVARFLRTFYWGPITVLLALLTTVGLVWGKSSQPPESPD